MANIVITGSSKGIGFGLASEFAARGHNITLAGSNQESVAAALETMTRCGHSGAVRGAACDVSQPAQVQALWYTAHQAYGSVDIWINNAGLARTTWSIADTPDDQIEKMIASNLLGTTLGSKVAVRGMLKQGHGKLFNILGGGSGGEYFPGMIITEGVIREIKADRDNFEKSRKTMNILCGAIDQRRTRR